MRLTTAMAMMRTYYKKDDDDDGDDDDDDDGADDNLPSSYLIISNICIKNMGSLCIAIIIVVIIITVSIFMIDTVPENRQFFEHNTFTIITTSEPPFAVSIGCLSRCPRSLSCHGIRL